MNRPLNQACLKADNAAWAGTLGVSQNNAHLRFLPAFRDERTGRVELARRPDGKLATLHLLCGLPDEWVVARDAAGEITAVSNSIEAGFVRDGRFYTREEAAAAS